MRSVLAAAALAVVAAGLPADAGKVPTPVLAATGGTQRGHVVTYTETGGASQRMCRVMVADGTESDPDPVRHDASGTLNIRLDRADRPTKVSVRVERVPAGLPLTAGWSSSYTLRPVQANGRTVGWDVVLPPPGAGDLRLAMQVQWRGACGADGGYWRFHVLAL